MMSSIYAPEIANHQGLEVPFDGIEHKQEELEYLPNSTPTVHENDPSPAQNDVRVAQRRWSSLRDRRLLLVGLAAAIIASVVIGAVIGTRKLQHASLRHTPSSSPNPKIAIDLSQRIRVNTSIASTVCPNGDRWVFVQDQQNSIRAVQRKFSSSAWDFLPNTTVPSNARPGSPLSVSCVTLPANDTEPFLTSGDLISLIYFDTLDRLGQSYFIGASWHSVFNVSSSDPLSPLPWPQSVGVIPPASIPASSNSRLTISTNVVPAAISNIANDDAPSNNSFTARFPLLSSVATYQTETIAVMVDLVGTTAREINAPYSIGNLLSQFTFVDSSASDASQLNLSSWDDATTQLSTPWPGGLTCVYNVVDATNNFGDWRISSAAGNVSGAGGNLVLVCVSLDVVAVAAYEPYLLGQNSGAIVGEFQEPTNVSYALFPPLSEPVTMETPFDATDLTIIPLTSSNGSQYAAAYLDISGRVSLRSIFTPDWGNAPSSPISIWSEAVPYRHISSCTSDYSTTIYTYFQFNETAIGQVQFNPDSLAWTLDPVYLHIDED